MLKLNTTMKKDKINQIFKDVFNLFLIEIKKKNYGCRKRFINCLIQVGAQLKK
tara:strand:- start:981 stop:1139 length:159 start_codon:yes stop_codon:yes gene_type:complete